MNKSWQPANKNSLHSNLGSNPRGTTLVQHLKTAVPHIEIALLEIKNGSSKTAEIILQALKEVLQ